MEIHDVITLEPATAVATVERQADPGEINLFGPTTPIPLKQAAPYLGRTRFFESIAVPLAVAATYNVQPTTLPQEIDCQLELFRNKLLIATLPVDLSVLYLSSNVERRQLWTGAINQQFQNPIPIQIGQSLEVGFSGRVGPIQTEALIFLQTVEVHFDQRVVLAQPGGVAIEPGTGSMLYSEQGQ